MKTLWIVLIVALVGLITSVASASDFCLWTLADSDNVVGRVGYALGENIEGGIEYTLNTHSDKPGSIWGVFGVYKAPEAIEFNRIFSNDWIPALIGTPYAGVSMSVDFDSQNENRTRVGPIAGVILQDILVVEYFYQFISDDLDAFLNDEYVLRIGLHFEF